MNLKELADKNNIIRVFGVPKNGSKVKFRFIKVQTNKWTYGYYSTQTYPLYLEFYSEKTKKRSRGYQQYLRNCEIDKNFFHGYDGITYYLNPKEAYSKIIQQFKDKKRELDRMQMEAQCEAIKFANEAEELMTL